MFRVLSTLSLRKGMLLGDGGSGSRNAAIEDGLVPKICDAPFRYDKCMFSLLGEGDRPCRACPVAAAK